MYTDKIVKDNLGEPCVTYRFNASHVFVGIFREERRGYLGDIYVHKHDKILFKDFLKLKKSIVNIRTGFS